MWILILTLCTHVNSGCSNSVTAVHGFTSESACMVAANFWLDRTRRVAEFRDAICVKA